MKLTTTNRNSFTGPLQFVALFMIVAAIGGMGYALQERTSVVNRGSSKQSVAKALQSSNDTPTPISPVAIDSTDTAAHDEAATVESVTALPVEFDVTTPYGSLRQVESYFKSKRPEYVAYFVSKGLQERGKSKSNQDKSSRELSAECQASFVCRLAIDSTALTDKYVAVTQPGEESVQTLKFELRDINSAAAVLYGNKQVEIRMRNVTTHWVIDNLRIGDQEL